tara:strand:- start:936 stop:1157 length:222 start_codon:yes stop_codon:yes gene_type:complete
MEKNKKLLFIVLITVSVVYLVKDIVVHEYKYWQCTTTKELIDKPISPENRKSIIKQNMRECLSLVNGVKEYSW